MKLGNEVGLAPGHIVLDGDSPRSPFPKGAQSAIYGPYLFRQTGCMDQDANWYRGRPQPRRLCVRWGPSPPSPKRGPNPLSKGVKPPPQFLAHFYCGQTAGCIKIPLRLGVGVSPGDFVFDGDPAPSLKRGQSPQFSAHVYCGQTAASIKIPLGTEVGLGPDDIVLYGDPATPLQKGGRTLSPIFGPCLLCPNGWMDQDGT